MPTIARVFGIVDDTVAGGSDYDAIVLAAGTPLVADASIFWPVTGGTFDPNIERIDRNAEVRGRRANTAPLPFRAGPTITVPVAAYRTVLEKVLYKCFGSKTTTGGTGAVPYTHTLKPTGFGTIALPACHVQLVRDDFNLKMAGSCVNRVTLNFPLDGEGTAEIEFMGLWFTETSDPAPTVTFTGQSADPFILRDAKMFIDGSPTAVQDLTGFSFSYANNFTRKWYAGRDIQTRSLGTPTQTKRLWFPAQNKATGAPDTTYSIAFGNTVAAQEIANWFSQVEKLVFECTAGPLGGSFTASTELLRITLFNAVNTGGGAEALTARDDITSSFDGGFFYSTADSTDVKIEIISDTVGTAIV